MQEIQKFRCYGVQVEFHGYDKQATKYDAIDALFRAINPLRATDEKTGKPDTPKYFFMKNGYTKLIVDQVKGNIFS